MKTQETQEQSPAVMPSSNPPQASASVEPTRAFVLRLSIGEPLYQKLMLAHEKIRARDGSRAKLSDVIELALDALMSKPRVATSSANTSEDSDANAPETVRAPATMRWHPSIR